ncbi:glucoamylase family protein [Melghirimyces profundicolus]|nr:glucoamylase family protein [Melghirimyces profundicolus]
MRKWVVSLLSLVLVASLHFASASAAPGVANPGSDAELRSVAQRTWQYFADHTDPHTHLPLDEVRILDSGIKKAEHTSPTNIGMYMLSTVSAHELGFIKREEAVQRMQGTLNTLEKMEKWRGFLYNWYYTKDATLKKDWGQFISSVDNGWYASGLIVIRQAYPELSEEATALLDAMDFADLYNPEVGQLYGGYDVAKGSYTGHTYGMFNTEPRAASYIGIGKGDLPTEHWWKMYRTFPPEWEQQQTPEGHTENYDGVDVYEGHYEYKGIQFVPSWGGSMFETLMPTIVIKEKELGQKGLGLNDKRQAQVQMAFAKEKGYPAWGFSPCAIPDGYTEYGVAEAGTWKDGYKDDGTVTPHASILALDFLPGEVKKNMKVLKELGAYGKYGYYDSVNVKTGEITPAYLALDQGMIMVSITNHLKGSVIRNYFHQDKVGRTPERLLEIEEFSIQD